jgi:hypothetical protein
LQELKGACRKFGIYHAVWADRWENMDTWHSAILQRLMHTDTYPTATSNLLKPLMAQDQNAVPILAGESGSGKTHHLLTCDVDAVTVYVLSLPGELKSVETVAEELKEAAKNTARSSFAAAPSPLSLPPCWPAKAARLSSKPRWSGALQLCSTW